MTDPSNPYSGLTEKELLQKKKSYSNIIRLLSIVLFVLIVVISVMKVTDNWHTGFIPTIVPFICALFVFPGLVANQKKIEEELQKRN